MNRNSILSIVNQWGIRIFATFWVLFLLLDYIKHHIYYGDAINYFSYAGVITTLLIIFLGFIYFFSLNKKLNSISITNVMGIKVYSIFLFILTAIFLSFGKNIDLFNNNSIGEGLFYFLGQNIAHHLWLFIFTLSGFSLGYWILKLTKTNFNGLSKDLVSIGIGFSILGITLFILGLFKLLVGWIAIIILILPIILNFKESLSFCKKVFLKQYSIENIHILYFIPAFILLVYVGLNISAMIRPIPIGFDASNLYLVTPKLISEYQGITQGGQAYFWSLIMSLGFIIFNNASYALVLSILPGILSILLIYRIGLYFLSKEWSLILSAIFYTTPMILFHSTLDAKVDLAALFFVLLAVLVVITSINNKEDHNKIYLLLGWLCGISFVIKYTSLFAIFAFITIFLYRDYKKWGYIGGVLLLIALTFIAKLYNFTSVAVDEEKTIFIILPLLIIGSLLFIIGTYQNQNKIKSNSIHLLAFGFAGFLTFTPWMGKHLYENKEVNISTIFNGKNPAPTLNIQNSKKRSSNLIDDSNYRKSFDYKFGSKNKNNSIQNVQKKTKKKENQKEENTSKHEEINRYTGYETGVIKYLSLFYDLTMNTNVDLMHIDIGFLLLILIPLLAFARPPNQFYWNILKILFIFSLLIFSIYSVWLVETVAIHDIGKEIQIKKLLINTPLAWLYMFLFSLILNISGSLSSIYYFLTIQNYIISVMLILVLFCLLFFFFRNFIKTLKSQEKTLLAFLSTYLCLWLLIGGGITWYAMPGIPLGILVFFIGFQKENSIFSSDKYLKYLVLIVISISLVASIPLRLSAPNKSMTKMYKNKLAYELEDFEYYLKNTKKLEEKYKNKKELESKIKNIQNALNGYQSKFRKKPDYTNMKNFIITQYDNNIKMANQSIFEKPFAEYLIGKSNYKNVLEKMNNSYYDAVKVINANPGRVYKVGTYINYYIEFGDTLVFEDNQLGAFSNLYDKSKNNENLSKKLQSFGFKYLIVDLKTATLDRTPGKTLTAKWEKLKDFFTTNSQDSTKPPTHIKLITTDYDGKNGSIAVFELI